MTIYPLHPIYENGRQYSSKKWSLESNKKKKTNSCKNVKFEKVESQN